jgi:hypothetical protein
MRAQVKQHNGTPTLFLDGQPVFADCHWVGSFDSEYFTPETRASMAAFRDANIHIYCTDAMADEWTEPGPDPARPFDFSPVAQRLRAALEVDGEALFILRIMVETKYLARNWWNTRYPDELEVLSDDQNDISASFASQVWQDGVKQVLRAHIAFLRQEGLYDHVIAYQICTGVCGEWIKSWSSMGLASGDASTPMLRAFRDWLRQKYGTDAALQAAWADPAVTLETACVPTGEEQDKPSHFLFRDPRRDQKVIDFNACYAETAADALLDFCRAVKQETLGETLTGAFFGYLMDLAWNDTFFNDGYGSLESSQVSTIQRSSHLGLAKVLRSPDIDFLVSPYTYHFRGLGGDGLPMQPTESLRIHGKLYLFEEDTLMHNNFDASKRMHPVSRSIAIYQRNFAQVLTHGLGITWLENAQFPEDPSIVDEAHRWQKRYQAIGTWALQLNRQPSAEVAVFLDDESYLYESNRNNIDLPLIAHQRVMSLNRFGAPHDLYLLNDLLEGRLPPYKLYIFLNAFHLDQRRRQALRRQVCRNNQTALWYYAPGYLNADQAAAGGDAISLSNMSDLTGFSFGVGRSYWSVVGHVTDFAHPITRDVPQDLFWGSTRPIAPIFHLEDPEAAVLGEIIYGLGRCKPGLAVKRFDSGSPDQAWHSIYAATPNLPAAVLRGIARFAGVHLYSDAGDVLYATPDLLSLHTAAGGWRNLKLPRPVEVVYDLFNNCEVARDTAQFDVQLPPASTALYYTGPAGALTSLRQPV